MISYHYAWQFKMLSDTKPLLLLDLVPLSILKHSVSWNRVPSGLAERWWLVGICLIYGMSTSVIWQYLRVDKTHTHTHKEPTRFIVVTNSLWLLITQPHRSLVTYRNKQTTKCALLFFHRGWIERWKLMDGTGEVTADWRRLLFKKAWETAKQALLLVAHSLPVRPVQLYCSWHDWLKQQPA